MAFHGELVLVDASGAGGRRRSTLVRDKSRSKAAVDLGPIIVVSHDGVEIWVGENAHAAIAGGDEDLFAAPAKGDLVGLHGLLVACQGDGLGRREDVYLVALLSFYHKMGD